MVARVRGASSRALWSIHQAFLDVVTDRSSGRFGQATQFGQREGPLVRERARSFGIEHAVEIQKYFGVADARAQITTKSSNLRIDPHVSSAMNVSLPISAPSGANMGRRKSLPLMRFGEAVSAGVKNMNMFSHSQPSWHVQSELPDPRESGRGTAFFIPGVEGQLILPPAGRVAPTSSVATIPNRDSVSVNLRDSIGNLSDVNRESVESLEFSPVDVSMLTVGGEIASEESDSNKAREQQVSPLTPVTTRGNKSASFDINAFMGSGKNCANNEESQWTSSASAPTDSGLERVKRDFSSFHSIMPATVVGRKKFRNVNGVQ